MGASTQQVSASTQQQNVTMQQVSAVVERINSALQKMAGDPTRLLWQDGLPDAVRASVDRFREPLDQEFCAATAGLEMEREARRALRVALE